MYWGARFGAVDLRYEMGPAGQSRGDVDRSRNVGGGGPQPLTQLGPPAAPCNTTDCDSDGLALADQDHQALTPGDPGVEQITLQHGVVLGHDRDDHSRVFRALTLVYGRGVGRHQGVKLAEAIRDQAPLEAGGELAGVRVNIRQIANVAVV